MKRRKAWFIVSVITAVLVCGCGGSSSTGTAEESSSLEEAGSLSSETESMASRMEFSGVDMDGNEVSEEIFSKSKLTMVNVWAAYCNPCLSEMPGLGELAGAYSPEEFQIIGIISDVQEGAGDGETETAADLIAQTGADYPHLLLNESIYNALLADVTAVPTTFFVDEDGEILDVVVGAMEKSAWEEMIHGFLEE